MSLVHQASAAVALVVLWLCFRRGGMVSLMQWGEDHLAKCIRWLSPWRFTMPLVQFLFNVDRLGMWRTLGPAGSIAGALMRPDREPVFIIVTRLVGATAQISSGPTKMK